MPLEIAILAGLIGLATTFLALPFFGLASSSFCSSSINLSAIYRTSKFGCSKEVSTNSKNHSSFMRFMIKDSRTSESLPER